MKQTQFIQEVVNIRTIEGATAQELDRFRNLQRKERLPDDPPIPLEENLAGWHNIPEFVDVGVWAIWNPDHSQVIASGEVETWNTQDNQHLGSFEISVHPNFRQQGHARRLLKLIADETKRRGRRLLLCNSWDRIPAGEAFLERLMAERGLEMRTNQLLVDNLDRHLIREWLSTGKRHAGQFELVFLDGAYPDDRVDGFVELFRLVNDAPKDNLEIEDQAITAEELRQQEQYMENRGTQRWTFYVRELPTGRFCGFTETFWNANRGQILEQGFTGVHPDFRGKNIGRWLKAAMIEKVLRERPEVTKIRTGNANSNQYMLAINNEMGFSPYMAMTVWQIEVQKIFDYLNA